jgi:predicted nucleic acid-binding Zn ribbon protein
MIYLYKCEEHGIIESQHKMGAAPKVVDCPLCMQPSPRTFQSPPVHYNAQGFHRTDYDAYGDKKELLNSHLSAITGEKPPKAASEVPRNSSDKH